MNKELDKIISNFKNKIENENIIDKKYLTIQFISNILDKLNIDNNMIADLITYRIKKEIFNKINLDSIDNMIDSIRNKSLTELKELKYKFEIDKEI